MSVRMKLQICFLVFILALLSLGGWSALRFRQLGGVTQRIISENYDSVESAQRMKENLERMDSAAVFLLLGQGDRARSQAVYHRKDFDTAFQVAASNITEPGESEIIARLKRDRDNYYQEYDRFFDKGSASQKTYFETLEPLFTRLRTDCDSLLQLNQGAMNIKAQKASASANRWFELTLLIALTLFAASLAFSAFASARIVRPLKSLRDVAARIAGGDLSIQAPVESKDEIGVLATEFNRMAMSLADLRRSDRGRLLIAQQTAEATIDSLYDPVIVTDAEGRVTRFNPAAERLFGTEAAALGKPVGEATGDSRISTAVTEVLNWQRPVVGEGIASAIPISLNGSEQSYRVRTTLMREQTGRLLGTVVMLENVTRLREVDRFKTDFVANASSQLDEPVHELDLGLHCLLSEVPGELNDVQRDLLYTCRAQVERWGRIREDLLTLASLESGDAGPRLEIVDPMELLTKSVEAMRYEVEASELRLHLNPENRLPQVLADPLAIQKVLRQLLDNARRNTPRGGEINIGAIERGDYVAISVSDTGKGIPTEYLPQLFNRFARIPGSQSSGSGLGLAIVRRLVEAHGGQISVQSEPGRGTVVTFTLLRTEDRDTSQRRLKSNELESVEVASLEKIAPQFLKVRPGGMLVTARDFTSLHYLRRALSEVDDGEQDVVVMTVRIRNGANQIASDEKLTESEHLLFTRAMEMAAKLGRGIRLLVVPGSDAFQTTVETAVRLECSTLVAGASARMSAQQQARRIGEVWEDLPIPGKRKLRILRLISIEGKESVFEIGAHRPTIANEDVELTHKLWLELSKNSDSLHHNEVISIALRNLAEKVFAKEPNIIQDLLDHGRGIT